MVVQDYLYHVTETAPLPNGRSLWVLDLKGTRLTSHNLLAAWLHMAAV